jgi:hypothetical protein
VTAEVARLSVRPPEFVSSSPVPKNIRKQDPLALALYAAACAGVLAFAAVTVIILRMAAPIF